MVFQYLTAGGVGGGNRGYDADTVAWYNAVVAAGGAVSGARFGLIDALIFDLKACGAWALRDDYAIYAAENSTQALVTLKRQLTQVAQSSPGFVANRGFLGNLGGNIKTGWNPSSVGSPNFLRNSASVGFWVYSAPSTNTRWFMGIDHNVWSAIGAGAANVDYGVNGTAAYDTWAHGGLANTVGWHHYERTGASAQAAYLNAVAKGTPGAIASVAIPNFDMSVLSTTNNGTNILGPTDAGISAAAYGAPLPDQKTGEYNALRAFMTAVGVP